MKAITNLVRSFRRAMMMFSFQSSEKYWIERYEKGGNSGFGSYGDLAQYKAEVINTFVATNGVRSVIEFGCGDGNQLKLARYLDYVGYDISQDAISLCRKLFMDDSSKAFYLVSEYNGKKAELALSLDVVYHLVEDGVFETYMRTLFAASQKYVIIYSTNEDKKPLVKGPHIKHRCFTEWVRVNLPDWKLINHIPGYANPGKQKLANVDFYIYEMKPSSFAQ